MPIQLDAPLPAGAMLQRTEPDGHVLLISPEEVTLEDATGQRLLAAGEEAAGSATFSIATALRQEATLEVTLGRERPEGSLRRALALRAHLGSSKALLRAAAATLCAPIRHPEADAGSLQPLLMIGGDVEVRDSLVGSHHHFLRPEEASAFVLPLQSRELTPEALRRAIERCGWSADVQLTWSDVEAFSVTPSPVLPLPGTGEQPEYERMRGALYTRRVPGRDDVEPVVVHGAPFNPYDPTLTDRRRAAARAFGQLPPVMSTLPRKRVLTATFENSERSERYTWRATSTDCAASTAARALLAVMLAPLLATASVTLTQEDERSALLRLDYAPIPGGHVTIELRGVHRFVLARHAELASYGLFPPDSPLRALADVEQPSALLDQINGVLGHVQMTSRITGASSTAV